MKRKNLIALLLAAAMLLPGCGARTDPPEPTATVPTVQTEPAPTVPADGNPEDVTCKGSYSSEESSDAVVAVLEDTDLTNRQLLTWYLAEIARYRQSEMTPAPDFSQSLDTQPCPVDGSVNSWQQYFLKRALNAWHISQALAHQARADDILLEEAYKPNLSHHEQYMTGMSANRVLYGYEKKYKPNTLHQAYLDALPEQLNALAKKLGYADAYALAQAMGTEEEMLTAFARDYNFGYMYFTELAYEIAPASQDVEDWFARHESDYASRGITRENGRTVNIRQILLAPDSTGVNIQVAAETLLSKWKQKTKGTEAAFSELAYQNTADAATALTGGAYRNVRQGQLPKELDDWCFAPEREIGDTQILQTESGVHILYFSGSTPLWYAQAEQDLIISRQNDILTAAKERFPMEVDYTAISLPDAEALLSYADILYPDVAHERFPEIPLYLQQDYAGTWYGAFDLGINGCGITCLAMLTTYMTDTPVTPPMLCQRYGSYSHRSGTDGMIYQKESAGLGFFLKEKTFDFAKAQQALRDGYPQVSLQLKGYWTGTGHYILLEGVTGDDMVCVRDPNIQNYGKIEAHKEDKHTWKSIRSSAEGFWIFEKKVTSCSFCDRCGEGTEESLLTGDYICPTCRTAQTRRDGYLNAAP